MQTVKRVFKWIGILLLLAILGIAVWIGPRTYKALYPSREHETIPPAVPTSFPRPAILIFSKTNGFRHEEAIPAASIMFRNLAKQNGWSVYETENGAVHSPELLSRFKAVVWSNASGDNLSNQQREALKAYIENGGGFVGIHAAGDSSHEGWSWYEKEVIGAHFVDTASGPIWRRRISMSSKLITRRWQVFLQSGCAPTNGIRSTARFAPRAMPCWQHSTRPLTNAAGPGRTNWRWARIIRSSGAIVRARAGCSIRRLVIPQKPLPNRRWVSSSPIRSTGL